MLDREDGPAKHYRYVCDGCEKETKRGIQEPPDLNDLDLAVKVEKTIVDKKEDK